MEKIIIVEHRIREMRLGSFSQYQLVVDCNLEPEHRSLQIVIVLRDSEDGEDLARSIETVINAGNVAIENAQ